jgi:hypothetical protein
MLTALDTPTTSLVLFGACFAALQVWWIASLLQRNRRRRRAGEPLSSREFRAELERIFRRED